MQPGTEGERRRGIRQPHNPRDFLKLAALGGCVEWLATAALPWASEPDVWKKRLADTDKISPEVENKPHLEVLRGSEIDYDDIQLFMRPSATSARWERRILHVERFCAGANFALHNAVPADPGTSELLEAQEPEAWVSDRNWFDEVSATPPPSYPRILDNNGLYHVLQKKRFLEGPKGVIVGPPRRIYVKNPNGASVVAMIRTTPASQVEGFRNLFAEYITPTPKPNFSLRESPWWGGCFIISFNIPYYGITTRELQDCRTISGGGDRLRNRHDLGFLHLQDYGMSDGESSPFHDNPVLHQLMFSFMSTGKSNEYCTAACLDDDVFGDDLGEEPRLASEEEVVGSSDPILHKAELDFTLLPRSYALEALKTGLHKVVEHQENILDWFRASISRHTSDAEDGAPGKISVKELQDWIDKFPGTLTPVTHSISSLVRELDHFLETDVRLDRDALPQGLLWQSLRSEPGGLQSLLAIKQYRDDLHGIVGELKQLEIAHEGVRRKRKNDNEGEQQIMSKQVHRIAIAAFVFAIPNTVAQLYSAMPDRGYSNSWLSYVAMVMFCVLMGAAVTLYLSRQYWQKVRRWFERVVAHLLDAFRALRGHA